MACIQALEKFLQHYCTTYVDKIGEYPRYYFQGEHSPCMLSHDHTSQDLPIQWQWVKRKTKADFSNVEQALSISLWPEINDFYGAFFAAPVMFSSHFGDGELTQVWNEQDMNYLQQNIIGHLMMKQTLKQPLTWFIGLLENADKMITVDNTNGSVWIEIPGEIPTEKLADSICEFIGMLTPKVTPAIKHEEQPMPQLDHPGIMARMAIMWQNLIGKR